MKLTGSIVVYNHSADEIQNLINCFNDLSYEIQIYISDNSADSRLQCLTESNPSLVYIWNGLNLGFGRAHNIAIRRIKESNYHFIINPDVEFDSSIVQQLINHMKAHGLGICSPRAIFPNGQIQIMARLIPNPLDLIIRRISFLEFFFKGRSIKNQSPTFSKSPIECYFIHGFFLVCDFEVLQQMGGYDERFFMYMEDLDLIRRVSKIKAVHYVPSIIVKHHYNRQSGRSLKLFMFHLISMIKYFNKWGWVVDRNRKFLNRRVLGQLNDSKLNDSI